MTTTVNKILNRSQIMQPRIVSLQDLRAVLVPLCLGYPWAENAIVDLWKKGAPVPQAEGQPERRILIPEYFAQWWAEVQQRMGVELPPENIYPKISSRFKAHNM